MNVLDLDDKVAAAVIAAAGTVIGALIQLRIAWRKEMAERARGAPVTKKSRRGPVLAVGLLLVAAAIGGFAVSQYLVAQSDRESAALRTALQAQLAQINATAERLERATLGDHSPARGAADSRTGSDAVTVTATVGPCRPRTLGPDAPAACAEQDAEQVMLCASLPSSAVVTDVELYSRPEASALPWSDSRVAAAQDIGRARFADKAAERGDSEQAKQVCTGFSSWDGAQALSARLVVKYVVARAVSAASNSLLVPASVEAR